jgi:hypothetical protein
MPSSLQKNTYYLGIAIVFILSFVLIFNGNENNKKVMGVINLIGSLLIAYSWVSQNYSFGG